MIISRLLKGRRTSCSGDFNKNLANRKRICEEKSRACKFRFILYQRRLGVRPSRRHYAASRAFCLCGRFCRDVEESVRGNHTGRHEPKNERRTVIDRDDLAQSRTITSTTNMESTTHFPLRGKTALVTGGS